MNEPSDLMFWGKLGHGSYPEESHPVVCHLQDVRKITGHEQLRPLPGKAFSQTFRRLPPVNFVHFAPVEPIRPCSNVIKPGLRHQFTRFIWSQAVNQVLKHFSSLMCWQQQHLLSQLFQCHGNCLFEPRAFLSRVNQMNLLPKALHGDNL